MNPLQYTGFGGTTLVFVLVFGVIAGASAGYAADSPDEATIAFNGTHLNVAGESSNVVDVEEREYQPDPVTAEIEQMADPIGDRLPQLVSEEQADQFSRTIIVAAFTLVAFVADPVATFSYEYLRWAPPWLFKTWMVVGGVGIPALYFMHRIGLLAKIILP